MEVSEELFAAANRRGAFAKAAFPTAVAVRYDRRSARLVISLSSGIDISFSPKQAQGLEAAQAADLAGAQISPSGLGVHFPKLMQTCTSRRSWKVFWAHGVGWRHKTAGLVARPPAKRKP
jgi:hypothetical protein